MSGQARERELHFQGVSCDVCGEVYPRDELDRHHWCDECRPRMRNRMRLWRHVVAALIALPIGIWVFTHPMFENRPVGFWALFVVAAYYLGYRLGREVVRIYTRLRGVR